MQYYRCKLQIDRAFDTWSRRMERLFRPFEQPLITSTTAALPSTAWSSASSRVLLPPVDLIDREKELIVQTELPVCRLLLLSILFMDKLSLGKKREWTRRISRLKFRVIS